MAATYRGLPWFVLVVGLVTASAEAQVVRIEITDRESVPDTVGGGGPYERLQGRIHGEVDPVDVRNR